MNRNMDNLHGHDRQLTFESSGSTVVDRPDPRGRLVSIVIWVGVCAWLSDPLSLSIVLVAAIVIALAARIGASRLFSRLGSVTVTLIPAWIILPLIDGRGDPGAGPFSFHASGLLSASLLQARALAIVAVVILHQGTTPWNRWIWAAGKLGAPASFLSLATITLRYLPLLTEEGQRTMTAARARGFEVGFDSRGYGVLASLAGAGVVRSYYRSEGLHRAMLSRGYEGRFYPILTRRSGAIEYLFVAVSVVTALALVLFAGGVIG